MKSVTARRCAGVGVLLAAAATVAVLRPALVALGYGQFSWTSVGYAAVPLAMLWISGAAYYGLLRAGVLAAVITAVAAAVAVVLFVVALGLSLGGARSGSVVLALLWAIPPLLVLVLGAAAWRFLPPASVHRR